MVPAGGCDNINHIGSLCPFVLADEIENRSASNASYSQGTVYVNNVISII